MKTPKPKMQKTFSAKAEEVEKRWVLIDAEDLVVGRLAALIAKHLRGFRSIVEVRGHVSSAEAHDFPNGGTALSYQRAATVAEVLTSEGVDWKRIRLVACGAGEPVTTPAYDDASQRSNQRVEVIVTDRTLPDEGVPTTSEAPPDRAEK